MLDTRRKDFEISDTCKLYSVCGCGTGASHLAMEFDKNKGVGIDTDIDTFAAGCYTRLDMVVRKV